MSFFVCRNLTSVFLFVYKSFFIAFIVRALKIAADSLSKCLYTVTLFNEFNYMIGDLKRWVNKKNHNETTNILQIVCTSFKAKSAD